jgi:hypothetical protein
MKCEGCNAYNAHVIYLHEERFLLCPRCLKILKELDREYNEIIGPLVTQETLNKEP